MINLFYITNNIIEAQVVDKLHVEWLFVDLEVIGKNARQKGRNTVISGHSIEDVKQLREVLKQTRIMVRCNPIGTWSKEEIDEINETYGIDMVMLPYFKTIDEVKTFVELLDTSKLKPALLIETTQAIEHLEEILNVYPFEYVHIGLNDLHIERKTCFMFEPFVDGLLNKVVTILKEKRQKFGVGGIGKIGSALLPTPECLIREHIRIGSSGTILSRSFKGEFSEQFLEVFESELADGIIKFRECEKNANKLDIDELEQNYRLMKSQINRVVNQTHDNKQI